MKVEIKSHIKAVYEYNQEQQFFVRINEKLVEVPSMVHDILIVGTKYLVMLYSTDLTHLTRPHANGNIVCFDKEGNFLWEIEHREKTPDESPYAGYNPFHKMELRYEDGMEKVYAWNGDHKCEVDMETGKFLQYIFTK